MAQHYRDDQYVAADGSGNVVFTFKPPNANTAVTGTVAVFNSDTLAAYSAEVGSATAGLAWGSWFGVSPFQVQMLGETLIVRGSGNTAGKTYHGVLIGRADPLGQEDFAAPFSSAPVGAGGPSGSGVSQIVPGPGIGVAPPGGTGVVTVSNTGVLQLVAGTSITLSPAGGTGVVTINATESGTFVTVDHGGQETVQTTAASTAAFTVDVTQANVFDITLTANCTFTISGATNAKGDSITLILRQDATGSRTVTWPASVLWVGGTAPVLSANPHQVDLITMVSVDGGTSWFTFVAGLNLH